VLVLPAALFYDYLRVNNFPRRAYSTFILVSPMIFIFSSFSNFNLLDVIRPPILMIFILLAWMVYYLLGKNPPEEELSAVQ
jgi:hypothetical protein